MTTLRKHQFLKQFTKVAYTSGVIFLIAGLLLSLFSQRAYASPGNPTGASLAFTSGCSGDCTLITATVCNTGSVKMQAPVKWELHFSTGGAGQRYFTGVEGEIGMLEGKACQVLTVKPTETVSGQYWFKAYQPEGHPGTGVLWSNSCSLNACTVPQPTPDPTQTTPDPDPTKPTPDPDSTQPTPDPDPTLPTPDPDPTLPTPDPDPTQPTPDPDPTQPTPDPDPTQPTPDAEPQVLPLVFSHICKATGLEWGIENPNSFDLTVDWTMVNGSSGQVIVLAGASNFIFASPASTQALVFTWLWPDGEIGSASVTNGDDYCIVQEPEITPEPTEEPDGDPVPTVDPTRDPEQDGPTPVRTPIPPGQPGGSNPVHTAAGEPIVQLAPLNAPQVAASGQEVLIPVTGADHADPMPGALHHLLIQLGLVFIGMALMTQGISRKFVLQ
jgi:hypothetical protein